MNDACVSVEMSDNARCDNACVNALASDTGRLPAVELGSGLNGNDLGANTFGVHSLCGTENYKQTLHVGKIKRLSFIRQKRNHFSRYGVLKNDEKRLRQAIADNNVDLVQELLAEGVNPCAPDNKLRSPLHIAAAAGKCSIVELLLRNGADPNQRDTIGNTALHLAACTTNIPVITALLKNGTDVNLLDYSGRSPLHLALGRLRSLRADDMNRSTVYIKTEVMQVVDMLRVYMHCSKRTGKDEATIVELGALCERLEVINTREEIDCVTDLLSDLAKLQIDKMHAVQ